MNTLLDSLVDEIIEKNRYELIDNIYARCFLWRVIYHIDPSKFSDDYVPRSFTEMLYIALEGQD